MSLIHDDSGVGGQLVILLYTVRNTGSDHHGW